MTSRYKRRQLFVHRIQYWFIATTLIHFSCLLVVLYGVAFLPMVQPLDDPSVPWQDHARTRRSKKQIVPLFSFDNEVGTIA